MKKLTIGPMAKQGKRKVVGADAQLVDLIEQIADRTHRRMKDVTDTLLRFALENVIINPADDTEGEE